MLLRGAEFLATRALADLAESSSRAAPKRAHTRSAVCSGAFPLRLPVALAVFSTASPATQAAMRLTQLAATALESATAPQNGSVAPLTVRVSVTAAGPVVTLTATAPAAASVGAVPRLDAARARTLGLELELFAPAPAQQSQQPTTPCRCTATRALRGAGLHRPLTFTLHCDRDARTCAAEAAGADAATGTATATGSGHAQQCAWVVAQPLGGGLYADPFVAREADRLSALAAADADADVNASAALQSLSASQRTWQRHEPDIEAAAGAAPRAHVLLLPALSVTGGVADAAEAKVAVSARYHAPRAGGGSVAVALPPAVLVAACVDGRARAIGLVAEATEAAEGAVLAVPVADATQLTVVMGYTLVVTAIAVAVIARALAASPVRKYHTDSRNMVSP